MISSIYTVCSSSSSKYSPQFPIGRPTLNHSGRSLAFSSVIPQSHRLNRDPSSSPDKLKRDQYLPVYHSEAQIQDPSSAHHPYLVVGLSRHCYMHIVSEKNLRGWLLYYNVATQINMDKFQQVSGNQIARNFSISISSFNICFHLRCFDAEPCLDESLHVE